LLHTLYSRSGSGHRPESPYDFVAQFKLTGRKCFCMKDRRSSSATSRTSLNRSHSSSSSSSISTSNSSRTSIFSFSTSSSSSSSSSSNDSRYCNSSISIRGTISGRSISISTRQLQQLTHSLRKLKKVNDISDTVE
jgi:hypothetical protein